MRKTLLIVAMLLLVSPVMAATTVNVLVNPADQFTGPDGNRVQPVSIAYTSTVDIRAFALDINIDNVNGAPNFQKIRNFKVGESNGAMVGGVSGYGIFPSRFRDFIQVLNGSTIYAGDGGWNDPNYNPTTSWNEPGTTDHTWGMGFPKMIIEMGTLYSGDANKPAQSGTLFTFDVNSYGLTGTYHITVAADTLRGGVVNTDGNTIVATMVGNDVTFACTVPNVVGQAEATATANIIAANYTLGTRTTTCSPTVAAGSVISTNPAAGPATCGVAVAYVVSTGLCVCTVPNVVAQPEATATANIIAANFTLGTRTTTCSPTIAAGSVISTNPIAGATPACGSPVAYVVSTGLCCITIPTITGLTETDANTAIRNAGLTGTISITYANSNTVVYGKVISQDTGCVAANATIHYVASYGCFPSSDPAYSDWVSFGKPTCWCYPRQCHGDADGLAQGTAKTGLYYVGSNDLNVLVGAWQVYEPTKGPGIATITVNGIPGICADFAHDVQGTAKAGLYRVGTNDLSRMVTYWNILEPTKGAGTPANCGGTVNP
jgi:beta-lactam-binding protein with PASTA domain